MADMAVILLSGGMDSLVTAGIARDLGRELALLHVDYGQRTRKSERQAFSAIADHFGIPTQRRLLAKTDLFRQVRGSSLIDPTIPIQSDFPIAKGIPNSYVPFRNGILLSMATAWTESLGARDIWYGAVEADATGYPDCRSTFVEAFQKTASLGTRPDTSLEISTPLLAMTKKEVVEKGLSMDLPFHLTWSCYRTDELACGTCPSCQIRLQAFAQAGVPDPLTYAQTETISNPHEKAERLRNLLRSTQGKADA